MSAQSTLTLTTGSKIAVIGAGPAGSFFALFCSQLAKTKGLELSITLFDWKDFSRQGPQGCNLCAGVISETLTKRLTATGIVMPEGTVQRKIKGYYLQTKAGGFLLEHPLGENKITTVFRGNGPKFSGQSGNIGFDAFLLDHVQRHSGVRVVFQPVREIILNPDPRKSVRIIYGKKGTESTFEADLVVCAFGLNKKMMEIIRAQGFGYKPPQTLGASCLELPLDTRFIQHRLGNNIFICNWRSRNGIRIAGIIPKKNYVTVNVIGRGDVGAEDINKFLGLPVVRERLPHDWKRPGNLCSCFPKIAVTASKRPYTDRLVIIGDASCSRYYKNGIESAYFTALLAARTAVNLGISARAFRNGYFRQVRRMIIRDNLFGKVLFLIYNLVYESSFFSEVLLVVVSAEDRMGEKKGMRDILWNMYTGNIPYAKIFYRLINPVLQLRLVLTTLKLAFARVLNRN
jgi:flavin-dependent dehydrogenase